MVGVNVPIPVPMAFHSFGGWKRSLFGDHYVHGPEGVRFYTRLKTITAALADRHSQGRRVQDAGAGLSRSVPRCQSASLQPQVDSGAARGTPLTATELLASDDFRHLVSGAGGCRWCSPRAVRRLLRVHPARRDEPARCSRRASARSTTLGIVLGVAVLVLCLGADGGVRRLGQPSLRSRSASGCAIVCAAECDCPSASMETTLGTADRSPRSSSSC